MMKISFDAYSDIGGRAVNEDAYCSISKGNRYLFAVADGLGGHDSGEIASNLAVDTLRNHFINDAEHFAIEKSIQAANDLIIKQQEICISNMRTTICAAYITPDTISLAHVGDSRIYAFDNSQIVFQSLDHSVAQLAVMQNIITASEIRQYCDRNILTRALGAGDTVKVDLCELNTSNISALLLCSDGFWEHINDNEINELRCTCDTPCVWMKKMKSELANKFEKSCDNHTAISIIIGKNS